MEAISKIEVGGTVYGIVPPAGLTEEQQAQARANIGAISATEADVVSDGTYPDMTVGNATHAQTADNATNATNAVNAQKATADANGNNIPDIYLTKAQWLNQEHPVGSHHIQFNGEATPAARFGGTWEIDTDYTGRVLVGAGTGFTLGETGGSEKSSHNHGSGTLYAQVIPTSNNEVVFNWLNVNDWTAQITLSGTSRKDSPVIGVNAGTNVEGSVSATEVSIMQSYKVVAVWKRTA